MTAAWAAGLVSVSREHPRGRGQCVFKCARLCEIECVAMRSSSGGVCKALGEEHPWVDRLFVEHSVSI